MKVPCRGLHRPTAEPTSVKREARHPLGHRKKKRLHAHNLVPKSGKTPAQRAEHPASEVPEEEPQMGCTGGDWYVLATKSD
jgi:hypothetical protein